MVFRVFKVSYMTQRVGKGMTRLDSPAHRFHLHQFIHPAPRARQNIQTTPGMGCGLCPPGFFSSL